MTTDLKPYAAVAGVHRDFCALLPSAPAALFPKRNEEMLWHLT